mgnify:CR=1 FL=1
MKTNTKDYIQFLKKASSEGKLTKELPSLYYKYEGGPHGGYSKDGDASKGGIPKRVEINLS